MPPTATLTIPIVAKLGDKEYAVGDLTLDVRVVNGRPKAPTAREIKQELRKGLS